MWIYQNHSYYSGNMPMFADWDWPKTLEPSKFRNHLITLVTGQHQAGGEGAICNDARYEARTPDTVYHHHFFVCQLFERNQIYFKNCARRLYTESLKRGPSVLPVALLDAVLMAPCPMWVGLLERELFKPGVKLRTIHELHRIVTIAAVCSWGRFYSLPQA